MFNKHFLKTLGLFFLLVAMALLGIFLVSYSNTKSDDSSKNTPEQNNK